MPTGLINTVPYVFETTENIKLQSVEITDCDNDYGCENSYKTFLGVGRAESVKYSLKKKTTELNLEL